MKTEARAFRTHAPLPAAAEELAIHLARALGVSLEIWTPAGHHGQRLALGPACSQCENEDPRTFDRCRKRRAYLTRPEVELPERLAEKCPRRVRLSRRAAPVDDSRPLLFAFGHGIDDPAGESDLGISCFLGDVRTQMTGPGLTPTSEDEKLEAKAFIELVRCHEVAAPKPSPAMELVATFVTALEARRPAQRGHARRVRLVALLLGRELGLDPSTQDALQWAALLHTASALGTPGPEDGEACALDAAPHGRTDAIASGGQILHTVAGLENVCTILQQLRSPSAAADPVPGLARAARCLDVADALDILLSQRASRRPRTLSTAVGALERANGRFDPHVLEALQRLQPQLQRHAWVFLLHRHGTV